MRVERQVLFWLTAAVVLVLLIGLLRADPASLRRRHRHRLLPQPRRRPPDELGHPAPDRGRAHRRGLSVRHHRRAGVHGSAARDPGATVGRHRAGGDCPRARPARGLGARPPGNPLPRIRDGAGTGLAGDLRQLGERRGDAGDLAVEPGPRAVQLPLPDADHAARRLLRADRLAPHAGQDRFLAAARPRRHASAGSRATSTMRSPPSSAARAPSASCSPSITRWP